MGDKENDKLRQTSSTNNERKDMIFNGLYNKAKEYSENKEQLKI